MHTNSDIYKSTQLSLVQLEQDTERRFFIYSQHPISFDSLFSHHHRIPHPVPIPLIATSTKDPRNPEVGPCLKNKVLIHAIQKVQVHPTLHLPEVHYKACSLHSAGKEWEGEGDAVLIRT